MGTLQQFRKISPYVFGIFAVLLVAFFTIGDPTIIEGIKGTSGGPTSQVMGKVNGDNILYVDYETKVREETENTKRQQEQQKQVQEIDDKAVRQRVWDQMVDEHLLKQQLKELGIQITDVQVREQMIDNPPEFLRNMFADSSGKFQRQLYLDLLTNPENYAKYLGPDPSKIPVAERQAAIAKFRKDLMQIEKYIRQTLQQQELQAAVAASGGIISPIYAKTQYLKDNSTADINFIPVMIKDLPQEEMKISKEEIEKYYNENKQSYKQKAQRKIKYIAFPIVPSIDDSTKAKRRIENINTALNNAMTESAKDSVFEFKLGEFSGQTYNYAMINDVDPEIMVFLGSLQNKQVIGPISRQQGTFFYRLDDRRVGSKEVVKASHILVNFGTNKDSSKAEASRILGEAKSGKEPFQILATKYSQDPGSARKGGDLGYFGKGQMVKEFDDAAFGANVGDIVGPVESKFGFHIIKVEDKKSEDIKYSEIKISPTISTATRSQLFREAVSIKKQVDEGLNFDTLAVRLKLKVVESPFFQENAPVLGSRYLSAIANQSKSGTVLEPQDLPRFGIVVAQVTDVKQEGLKVIEDVKMEITQKLTKIKKLDKIKIKIADVYNKVKTFQSLSAAMASDSSLGIKTLKLFRNTPSIPGLGQDAAFSAKVFSMDLNKMSEPIRGENGYYIIEVIAKDVPNDDAVKAAMPDYIKQQNTQVKNSVYYQWFQNIKEKSKIEDFRSKFYKDY
jgi:parvulin-like peptidyl-prolyl isomerase